MAHLQLHDLDYDVYAALPIKEERVDSSAWKTLLVDGLEITFFRPRGVVSQTAAQLDELGEEIGA